MRLILTRRQYYALCTMVLLSPLLHLVPRKTAAEAGCGGWLSGAAALVPLLLFAALLVLTAFAACSHEEKKPDGESDSYPSYTVNADDMNKEYKLDDIADLSLISSVDSAAAHFQGKEIRNVTKDLKKSDLEALVSALKGMTATAEEDKYPSKELKKSVYVQFKNDEGTERRVMSCFVIDGGCYLSFSETYLKGERFDSPAVIFRISETDAEKVLTLMGAEDIPG